MRPQIGSLLMSYEVTDSSMAESVKKAAQDSSDEEIPPDTATGMTHTES